MEDLLTNTLLAGVVKVTVVCSDKVLVLLMIVLTFLPLVMDLFDGLLSILMDARIASVGAFDDVDAIFKN